MSYSDFLSFLLDFFSFTSSKFQERVQLMVVLANDNVMRHVNCSHGNVLAANMLNPSVLTLNALYS